MTNDDPYRPVSCGIYDTLEAAAVLRKRTEIQYRDINGQLQTYTGRVLDVFSKGKEEFVTLEEGVRVRLDRIRAVDGVSGDSCSTD